MIPIGGIRVISFSPPVPLSEQNMESLDLSSYPPAPVTWAYNALDTVCEPLGCGDWRQLAPESLTQKGAWLSEEFQLKASVSELMPPLLTYPEYLQQTSSNYSLNSLKAFAFETPSTSLADVTTPSSMLVLVFLVIILRTTKAILLPLFSAFGRQAARHTHGKDWEKANAVRIVKFGEYVFRLFFHSGISAAGIWYFWDKEWWKQGGTKTLFLEYPYQEVAPGMTWYYLVQSAYNLEAMLSLLELSFTVSVFPPRIAWKKNSTGGFPRNVYPPRYHELACHWIVLLSLHSSGKYGLSGSRHFRCSSGFEQTCQLFEMEGDNCYLLCIHGVGMVYDSIGSTSLCHFSVSHSRILDGLHEWPY